MSPGNPTIRLMKSASERLVVGKGIRLVVAMAEAAGNAGPPTGAVKTTMSPTVGPVELQGHPINEDLLAEGERRNHRGAHYPKRLDDESFETELQSENESEDHGHLGDDDCLLAQRSPLGRAVLSSHSPSPTSAAPTRKGIIFLDRFEGCGEGVSGCAALRLATAPIQPANARPTSAAHPKFVDVW